MEIMNIQNKLCPFFPLHIIFLDIFTIWKKNKQNFIKAWIMDTAMKSLSHGHRLEFRSNFAIFSPHTTGKKWELRKRSPSIGVRADSSINNVLFDHQSASLLFHVTLGGILNNVPSLLFTSTCQSITMPYNQTVICHCLPIIHFCTFWCS